MNENKTKKASKFAQVACVRTDVRTSYGQSRENQIFLSSMGYQSFLSMGLRSRAFGAQELDIQINPQYSPRAWLVRG